ncbi:MAG: hypothetical protein KatS3mg055_2805 [Chloroflexus sp.]|nr:MAG: hypothetical protein KatS3mg055_2805 [Chloroflexus sp.]
MSRDRQPLAEVFGYLVTDQTDTAKRYRSLRLCPFNNKVRIAQRTRQSIRLAYAAFITRMRLSLLVPFDFDRTGSSLRMVRLSFLEREHSGLL